MRITISGPIGSGKSTVGKILAKSLGYQFFSGGHFFRQQAQERGMTIEEFNLFAESHKEIDMNQDQMVVDFLKSHDNVVVEARLAGWMCHRNGIDAFKVFLTASLDTRVSRISRREGSKSDLQVLLRIREESEAKRYMEFYSIDYATTDIYDLVINSDNLSAQKVAEQIHERSGIKSLQ